MPLDSGELAGRWVLDGQQSSLKFQSTSLWGLVKVRGSFATVRGEGEVGPDGATTGRLVADVASVDTGNKKRDTHLRSADFFDASTHPELVYEISRVAATGPDRVRLSGTLSVAGQSRPLELDAVVSDRDDDGVTLRASTSIDRSEWRIDWKKMGMTKMATPIEISARIVHAR
jgi:polyisoprenoid-binding protein YceI